VVTQLIFVRHGESHHRLDGVLAGPRACRGLTQKGSAQAAAVAARLAGMVSGPVAVYTSVIRRAIQTAEPVAAALGVSPVRECGLCSWHLPPEADGMPSAEFQASRRAEGGGVFRPFETGNETWAEVVTRISRVVLDVAHEHRGGTVIFVAHAETVEVSFHVLGLLPLYRSFDLDVAPASLTEWVTGNDPTQWPPARWRLVRFNAVA
jgi:probable phosphoglycerate mutase